MIGSMVPDFGYYVFQFQGTSFAHTPLGSITLCPLLGTALLLTFVALRRPLCYMLPQPHRRLLMPLASTPWRWDCTSVLLALLAIVVGAWTHLLWDAFTHVDRWFVVRIDWLQREVLEVRGHRLHGYSLLQYASSAGGVAVLAWAYWRWLQEVHAGRSIRWFAAEDTWRYVCLLGALAAAASLALPWAFRAAASPDGLFWLRTFVVRWLVGTTSWFVLAFVAIALVCYWRKPRIDAATG